MAKKLSDDGATPNTPGPDDTIKLFIEAERLKSRVDEANGKLRAHLKLMDERGVNLKAVALLRRLRKLDTEDATILFRDLARMGRWLQMPIFSQADMFPADDAAEPSDEGRKLVTLDDADREGFEAGKAGRAANDTRFTAGTEEYQAFARGWLRGQAQLAAKLTDDPEEKKAAIAAGGRKPGRRKKDDTAGAEA